MAIEALSSTNELLNILLHDTISATNLEDSIEEASFFLHNNNINKNYTLRPQQQQDSLTKCGGVQEQRHECLGVQGSSSGGSSNNKKKRKRKARVCKNKEAAETQRITHIFVERNRRKLMNEHLSVLKSLMPDSYIQRGDQASIVGGAIEYVKELEQLLQSLEAQRLQSLQGIIEELEHYNKGTCPTTTTSNVFPSRYFGTGYSQNQSTSNWSQFPNKYTTRTKDGVAEIEVTLIESHANLKILISKRSPKQLLKMVVGFQALCFTILHINVTAMDPLVLYTTSVKLEEGCKLTSVEDIAAAVHRILKVIIEEEEGREEA